MKKYINSLMISIIYKKITGKPLRTIETDKNNKWKIDKKFKSK